MAVKFSRKKTADIIKAYDRSYISKDVKSIKVDDDRPKKWTTLDVEPTGGVNAGAIGEIRKYQDKIKAINNEISNYDDNRLNKNIQESRLLRLKNEALKTRLNKLYSGKQLRDFKDNLSRANKLLKQINNKDKKDPSLIDSLEKIISANSKRIQDIRDTRSKLTEQNARLQVLNREISKARRINPAKLEEDLARMENRIMEARIKARDNTHIPYLSGEIRRAREEYDRLNIRFFESKEDMILFFNKHSKNFWKTHDIEKYWRDYKHRDELIANGQYQEYMARKYRENYIKALNRVAGNSSLFNIVVANLNKLNDQQLIDLFGSRDGDVTKTNRYVMPVISFVYLIEGVHDRGRADEELDVIRSIKDAFRSVGLEFDENISAPTTDIYKDIAKRRYKGAAKKQIEIEDLESVLQVEDILKADLQRDQVNVFTNNMDRAANFAFNHILSYTERVKYSPDEIDTYQKRRMIIKAMNKIGLRFNKDGEGYVPFFKKELVAELISDLKVKK